MRTPRALPSASRKAHCLSWPTCNLYASAATRVQAENPARTKHTPSCLQAVSQHAASGCMHQSTTRLEAPRLHPSVRTHPDPTNGSHQPGPQHTAQGGTSMSAPASSGRTQHALNSCQMPAARSAGMHVLSEISARPPHSRASFAFVQPTMHAALDASDITPCTPTYYNRTRKSLTAAHKSDCYAAQFLHDGSRHRQTPQGRARLAASS